MARLRIVAGPAELALLQDLDAVRARRAIGCLPRALTLLPFVVGVRRPQLAAARAGARRVLVGGGR